jgi:hypothetical protein
MCRRAVLVTLVIGITLALLTAELQSAERVWRIGYLSGGSRERLVPEIEALESGLRDLGYVEGRNAVFEQATTTIPVVMLGVPDPVGRGLIASLARPGGNITGLSNTVTTEHWGKRLQLLKEISPRVSRVAALDKILKGAKPAHLPVEQPTKFDLIVNLKTAKALGLSMPSPLPMQAHEVLQ